MGAKLELTNGEYAPLTVTGSPLHAIDYELTIASAQITLKQWLTLHPNSLIMQGDPAFKDQYAKDYAYERGTSLRLFEGARRGRAGL